MCTITAKEIEKLLFLVFNKIHCHQYLQIILHYIKKKKRKEKKTEENSVSCVYVWEILALLLNKLAVYCWPEWTFQQFLFASLENHWICRDYFDNTFKIWQDSYVLYHFFNWFKILLTSHVDIFLRKNSAPLIALLEVVSLNLQNLVLEQQFLWVFCLSSPWINFLPLLVIWVPCLFPDSI